MNKSLEVVQSELTVLGSVILKPTVVTKVLATLKADDFSAYDGLCKKVFYLIEQLAVGGKAVDLSSIVQAASIANLPVPEVKSLLLTAVDAVTTLEALETHLETVKESARKKQTIAILAAGLEEAKSWDSTAEELWEKLSSQSFDLLESQNRQIHHIWTGGEEHGLYVQRMEILRQKELRSSIYSGWVELDEKIPTGWARRDVSVIAARPGMGKSSWRFCLQRRLLEAGFGAVLISTEQSKETETDRQDSVMTGIPLYDVIHSHIWEPGDPRLKQVKEVNRYMDEHWNYDMLFGRQMDLQKVWEFMSVITRRREKDIVFIDLFDRLVDVNVSANKAQQVSKKLGEVAAMAEFFNVHVCLIVQISRAVERRANRRPMMSDLKDSGNYEEAARMILLLYRDAYYNTESIDQTMEVNIAKQNQGEAGPGIIIPFDFNPSILTFEPQASRGY